MISAKTIPISAFQGRSITRLFRLDLIHWPSQRHDQRDQDNPSDLFEELNRSPLSSLKIADFQSNVNTAQTGYQGYNRV